MKKVVFFTLALLLYSGAALAGLDPGEQAPNFQAPAFNSAQCGIKGPVSLQRYMATDDSEKPKAYLITFFATWCEGCIKEIPALKSLYSKLFVKGFRLVMVSIDTEDALPSLKDLVASMNAMFPVIWDQTGIIGRRYKSQKLPYAVLLDGDGVVVTTVEGAEEAPFHEMIAKLEKMLGVEPATVPQAVTRPDAGVSENKAPVLTTQDGGIEKTPKTAGK